MIEPLEARIAPAALTFLNSKTATFKDVDGDLVTISISKGGITFADYLLVDGGSVGGAPAFMPSPREIPMPFAS